MTPGTWIRDLPMAAFVMLTTVFYHRRSAESRPGVIEPVDVEPLDSLTTAWRVQIARRLTVSPD